MNIATWFENMQSKRRVLTRRELLWIMGIPVVLQSLVLLALLFYAVNGGTGQFAPPFAAIKLWGPMCLVAFLAWAAILSVWLDIGEGWIAGAKPQHAAARKFNAEPTIQPSPYGGLLIGDLEADRLSKELDDELATLLQRGRVVYRLMPDASPAQRQQDWESLMKMVESDNMVVFVIPSNGKA